MKRDIEGPIHKAILRLAILKFPGVFIFHVPNEINLYLGDLPKDIQRKVRQRLAVAWRKQREMGAVEGFPDLAWEWEGVFMAVEVKAPNGRLTDAQIEAGRRIVESGGRWEVARSVSEAEAIFDAWKAEIAGAVEIPHRGSIG